MNRETRIYSKIFALLSIVFFFTVLVFFGIVSFADVDPTVSETENRKLAEKPEFSVSALMAGTYTQDFENYYADTFPLREMFMSLNGKISSALTQFSGKEDNVIINYEKHDSDFVGEGVDVGIDKNDKNNKPEKETEKDFHADDKDASFKGSILVSKDRGMEVFSGSESMASSYAKLVSATAKAMPDGVKFYSMVVPTAIEFYGTRAFTNGNYSQKKAIQQAYKKMDSSVVTIDVYKRLADTADEYIYFRTDHHWTARGAYQAYLEFCDVTEQTPVKLEDRETGKIEGFVGSLYKASNSETLKENPDYVEFFRPTVETDGMIYADDKMENGYPLYVVSRRINSTNKYLAFIGGDQPLEKIVTSNKNGKKILVIKESYGNAFVPFICDNYEEVYVVDPRQTEFNLPQFVEEQGIGEVLMINYSFAMANKTFSDALYAMLDY